MSHWSFGCAESAYIEGIKSHTQKIRQGARDHHQMPFRLVDCPNFRLSRAVLAPDGLAAECSTASEELFLQRLCSNGESLWLDISGCLHAEARACMTSVLER